jgi:hypothetical protein
MSLVSCSGRQGPPWLHTILSQLTQASDAAKHVEHVESSRLHRLPKGEGRSPRFFDRPTRRSRDNALCSSHSKPSVPPLACPFMFSQPHLESGLVGPTPGILDTAQTRVHALRDVREYHASISVSLLSTHVACRSCPVLWKRPHSYCH